MDKIIREIQSYVTVDLNQKIGMKTNNPGA